jgi:hypothetical protein
VDRPQQNKTAFTKLIWNNLCGRCHSHGAKRDMMVAWTLDDEKTRTSVHVSNPLDEDVSSREAADRVRRITRSSFASVEHLDSNDTPTAIGTNKDILKTREKRASRKSHLLNFTKIVGGMKERTEEGWEKRLAAHGGSSQERIYQRKKQMALLFDLWDEAGDGFIDPNDMKSISKQYRKKIHVAFGNPVAWKRVQNIGVFSHQNFNQFFDWFVVQPTVDAISSSVMKGSPKKARQIQQRRAVRERRERSRTDIDSVSSKSNLDKVREKQTSFNKGRMRRLRLMKNKQKGSII